jgi:hypothetical protein
MADKVEKPKKSRAKPKKDEKGVLAALPSTRPERIGTRRAAAAGSSTPAKKPSAKTKKASTARATATRRKAAAPRTFEPTPAAESAAGVAAPPQPEPRPRAVREGAPGMGTTSPDRERGEAGSPESGRPSGVELVTTAVQAAGELTQIGLTIGGRIVKRALDRLPKP